MIGYIKYFENGDKSMSFVIKDDDVLDKYNKIWDKIKEKLNIIFHGVIKTNFLGDETPRKSMHYTCIDCITIDSVMRMEKNNYLHVYLEECKYRMKKTKITTLIEGELESESESELESEIELELKSELESDTE